MRFVLVHGSCAGAWAWGDVPSLLRDAGHDVVAPDLALSPGATPVSHAAEVAAAVAAAGDRDGRVVLAGHSYGGMVLGPLAERLREVAAMVVIDGLVPDPGESAFGIRPEGAAARRAAATARGDGCWLPEPEHGDPDWMARLVPMPLSAFEAPVGFAPLDVPRTFVHCTRSDMGAQAERARARGWRVVAVDAGHALPLEAPALCARLLVEGAETAAG